MNKNDKDNFIEDNPETEFRDHTSEEIDEVKVDYGILIFVDKDGNQDLQIIGKDRASLNDLLSLVHIAERKISTIWNSRNDPAMQVLQRDINDLRNLQAKQAQATGAIIEILTGIKNGLEMLSNKEETPDDNG